METSSACNIWLRGAPSSKGRWLSGIQRPGPAIRPGPPSRCLAGHPQHIAMAIVFQTHYLQEPFPQTEDATEGREDTARSPETPGGNAAYCATPRECLFRVLLLEVRSAPSDKRILPSRPEILQLHLVFASQMGGAPQSSLASPTRPGELSLCIFVNPARFTLKPEDRNSIPHPVRMGTILAPECKAAVRFRASGRDTRANI